MSSDQPVPPSIPPRKRPDGSAQPHPALVSPHIAPPTATVEPSVPAQSAAPAKPAATATPLVLPTPPVPPTPPAAPVASAAPATPSPSTAASVTSTMMKAIKSVVTGEPSRATRTSAPTVGDQPHPNSSKADPIIPSTDTHAAGAHPLAADGGTGPGRAEAPTSAPGPVRQASGRATSAGSRLPSPSSAREGAPRRVRLSISRVDPWSVMKLSFLLSVAIGIMIVIAAAVVWFALDGLAVFTKVNDMITEIVGKESPIDILQYVAFSRVVSGATVVAVIDVVLLTALSTIGAFLYNITAALVGGVTLTLTDD